MEWVLSFRSPTWTPFWILVTSLGDVTFYLTLLALGYWLVDRDRFRWLAQLTLASCWLNCLLKAYFQAPRPTAIPALVEAGGYSFPSGHAQLAATFWLAWALFYRRKAPWSVAIAMIVGVAASRVYLGVHWPRDVMAGVGIGALFALAGWQLSARFPRFWAEVAPWRPLGVLAGLVPVWLLFPAAIDSIAAIATGSWVGLELGARRLPADWPMPTSPWQIARVLVLGLGITFLLRVVLKTPLRALPISNELADAVRYGVIALWLSWWAPRLFVRSASPAPK